MQDCFVSELSEKSIPIIHLKEDAYAAWLALQSAACQQWISQHQFQCKPGKSIQIPAADGDLAQVLLCVKDQDDFWSFASLARVLPKGVYHVDTSHLSAEQLQQICLAWGLAHYQFTRYKKPESYEAKLQLPKSIDRQRLEDFLTSIFLVRNLINTPANDLGPTELAEVAKTTVKAYAAKVHTIAGEKLLKENYPAVYAVGKASSNPPHLVDIHWGDEKHPKITLVGKGVCFDSGGLDLKNAVGMRDMKKDMGGAAHVLGLAQLIMAQQLPVRLRVLIPTVENAVSGNSYRPGDVLQTRAGITVEVGNTDAEGRLILCDALAEATSEKPDCLIDFATLTGACRVALGTDLPAFFCNHESIAAELYECSKAVHDPIWRLPLYQPYDELLKSDIADVHNISSSPWGGGITAALYLQRFIANNTPWIHFDIMASNSRDLPGRPKGGEAMGLRATFEFIKRKYC